MGWSELSFQALYGLALTLRDRGEHADAVTALGQAIDVCERAGLAAQSVQATATRAVVLALAGRWRRRRASRPPRPRAWPSACTTRSARRPRWRRGRERRGPGRRRRTCWSEAEDAWTELERPLEAARCRLLAGFRLRDDRPGSAPSELLASSAEECERLGVAHLAEKRARAAGAQRSDV